MNVPDWRSVKDANGGDSGGELWDVLILDGKRLPGVAQVSIDCPPGIEIQKAKGSRDARLVDTGLPPIMLRVKLTIANASEVAKLGEFMDVLRPRSRKAATREVKITHPQALIWGFSSVQVLDVKVPAVKPGGAYIVEFGLVEWVPEISEVKETKKSNGRQDGTNTPVPTAREKADALKAEGKKNRQDNT